MNGGLENCLIVLICEVIVDFIVWEGLIVLLDLRLLFGKNNGDLLLLCVWELGDSKCDGMIVCCREDWDGDFWDFGFERVVIFFFGFWLDFGGDVVFVDKDFNNGVWECWIFGELGLICDFWDWKWVMFLCLVVWVDFLLFFEIFLWLLIDEWLWLGLVMGVGDLESVLVEIEVREILFLWLVLEVDVGELIFVVDCVVILFIKKLLIVVIGENN